MSLSNKTTLVLDLQVKGFDTGGRQVDAMTGKMKNAIGSFDTYGKSVDQAGTKTQSFSQKIQQFGSKFGQTIANVGTLGTTVLNLSRQYADLGDSQIAVEKAQRKVSTSTEAVRKAQDALAKATKKYGAGSKEAKQATLDLEQAQSGLSISTQLLTERQEDHQRAQENFWLGLGPTIASAGGTAMAAIKEITGSKGISGIGIAAEAQIGKLNKLKSALGGLTGAGAAGIIGAVGIPAAIVAGGLIGAQQLNQNVKEFQDIAAVTRLKYEAFLKTLGFGDAQIKSTMAVYDQLRNTLGITATDIGTLTTKSTEGYKKWISELRTAKQPLTDVVSEMQKWGFTNKEISATIAEVDAEMRKLNPTIKSAPVKQYADNWRFLGANLQPLPPLLDQMTGVLQTANASLAASGSGVSNLAAAQNAGAAAGAAYAEQTRLQIAEENARQIALFASARALGIKTAHEDDSVAILQLEIDRQAAAVAKDWDRVASLSALIKQMRQANEVAAQGVGKYMIKQGAKGQGPQGSVWRTFVGGKQVAAGPGMAPPLVGGTMGAKGYGTTLNYKPRKIKPAQTGMNERLISDTLILGHAGEDVRIEPPGNRGIGTGRGQVNVHVNVYLDGEKLGSNSTLVRKLRHTLFAGLGTAR